MTAPATISETADFVRTGACSAEQFVRDALDRIHRSEPTLNAFISVFDEEAVADARRIDSAREKGEPLGRLCGVPIAVKDNICTNAGLTTCGSRMLSSFESLYDAFAVTRLRVEGAIIIGKTNLDEFGMGSSCEHSVHGPTRNPWDARRVPGGSSGGSAAAVAARVVPGALGSDTGGSVRQPASFCGVVGLKPSYGRVSRSGLVAYGSSLDQIGPMATTVTDAALLLSVIAGHDAQDATCAVGAVPDYADGLAGDLTGVRVGVCEAHFADGLDASVARMVREALDTMAARGAVMVPIELPHMKYATACYYLIATAEASGNLARFDGVRYGRRAADVNDVDELYSASRGAFLGAEVQRRLMLGTYALSSGYYDAYYAKALKVRTLVARDFEAAFADVDVIASPAAPTTAFAFGEKSEDPLSMYLGDVYTVAANLAGLCAISIPAGLTMRVYRLGFSYRRPRFRSKPCSTRRTGFSWLLSVTIRCRQVLRRHRRDMIEHATVNSLLRCTQAYCNQLCEKHTLDFGIVYFSERFPNVAELNQFREVIAESADDVRTAMIEADAWFSQYRLTCCRWAPAMGRASDVLSAQLRERGFERRVDTAMRLSAWPTWDAVAEVRVLPARAMRMAYRATFDGTPSKGEGGSAEAIAEVALERLDDPSFDMFVAMVDKKPAGRCALYQVGDLAQVRDLYVLPEFANRDVEQAMLSHVLAMAKRLSIGNVLACVAADDAAGADWFERAGFVTDGEIEEYCHVAPAEMKPSS